MSDEIDLASLDIHFPIAVVYEDVILALEYERNEQSREGNCPFDVVQRRGQND